MTHSPLCMSKACTTCSMRCAIRPAYSYTPQPNPHPVTCHAHHLCLQQYNPYSAVWYNMTWGHASSAGRCAQTDSSASASPLTAVCLFVFGVAQTCFTGPTTRLPSTPRSPLITLECGLAHWYLQMLRRRDLKTCCPPPSRATHTQQPRLTTLLLSRSPLMAVTERQ